MGALSTRRGMLGAIALAPIVAAVAAAPASCSAEASSIMDLIAAYHRAEAAIQPASAAHQAALDAFAKARAAIPHYTTRAGYQSQGKGFMHMTTADPHQPGTARSMLAIWAEKDWEDDAYVATCRELVEADDRRLAEFARLRKACGVEAACADEERLAAAGGDALWAVYDFPVTTREGLLLKLDFVDEHGELHSASESLIADLRRVLGGSA
jgi:hypothetical protein